ncbi:alkaline shock response membrane anchor protein AmaP [Nocardiopsis sp. HNM0947]|uniref:Alkaline shock response membrane anchor protein AmaP n=1 Tax=Nocardiopsis coralli TaxID=2772213 RepID=A0ABR9P219_9ACTN|nr:DUF6286 domain-containing protein [Nocardiopsis coralli]MBE2997887.1 alkaline shock response membrane anchor protein AmaP [Nocardiopsis coralli]
MSANPGPLTRRPARSLPALLLAVTAITAGAAAAWLLGAYAIDAAWPAPVAGLVSALAGMRLDALPILIGAGALGLFGLALVICAIVPGDPVLREILADGTPGQAAVSRRDLALRVRRSVEHVDGVQGARVSVRRKRVDVVVRTPVEDTGAVLRRSRASVETAVEQLRPVTPLRPRVRVARTR